MTKVLLVGAEGVLGSEARRALEARGHDVARAGRSAPVAVDLCDPASFGALDGYRVVVNCSDSVNAPPDEAIAHVSESGGAWIETGSDPGIYRRWLSHHVLGERAIAGRLLLGSGVFPGLSNLLVAAHHDAHPGPQQLAIAWSPLCRGGRGLVDLATHLLEVPTHRYEGGECVEGPAIEEGPEVPLREGSAASIRLAFSEPDLLHASRGLDIDVRARFPGAMTALFGGLPLGVWQRSAPLMGAGMTVLRRGLLSWRTSEVELCAWQRPHDAGSLVAADGMATGGDVIAASVDWLLRARPGAYTLDQLGSLHEMLAELPENSVRAYSGPAGRREAARRLERRGRTL